MQKSETSIGRNNMFDWHAPKHLQDRVQYVQFTPNLQNVYFSGKMSVYVTAVISSNDSFISNKEIISILFYFKYKPIT